MLTYECVLCHDRIVAILIKHPDHLMCAACEQNYQNVEGLSIAECFQQEEILLQAWEQWTSLLWTEPFNTHKHG